MNTQAMAEGLREAGCEVDLFNTSDGRYDVTQFPQAARPDGHLRRRLPPSGIFDVAFGSPVCYAYLGNLKQFMADHRIGDVRKGAVG